MFIVHEKNYRPIKLSQEETSINISYNKQNKTKQQRYNENCTSDTEMTSSN